MRTLAIANHKGGVGKTTTAVNLAAALAQRGFRTLLVDADAQANATHYFVEDLTSVDADLQDVIVGGVSLDKVIGPTRIDGLHLLPATLALARLDVDLVTLTKREDRVRRALAPLTDRYDYVIIDLPPSLSLISVASLAAATDVITPVNPTRYAIMALGAFLGWIEEFRDEEVITARFLGVLVTMFEGRTTISREVWAALHDSELPLFTGTIPRRTGVEQHVEHRWVVGDHRALVDVGQAYHRFADEVLARLAGRT